MDIGDKLAAHEEQAARPTHAQTVRTLVSTQTYGTLCTMSSSPATQGYPNGAVAPFAADKQGRPIIALSDLSGHKRDLEASGRASLVVTEGGFQGMNDARCTLTGSFSEITDTEAIRAAREAYMERHPDAFWVDFGDFSFLRMDELLQIFVGGFGRISTIKASDYWAAQPDPVAQFSKPVCDHMNADHSETLIGMVKSQVGIDIEGGKMKSIDRLGFDTECTVNGNNIDIRLNYPEPAEDRKAVKDRIVQMTKAASAQSEWKQKQT